MIKQYSEKQIYDVFYKHYLELETIERNKAIELLNEKNFIEFMNTSYCDYSNRVIPITSVLLEDLLKEFQDILIQLPENSDKPQLNINDERFGNLYKCNYRVYAVKQIDSCKENAKTKTRCSMWQIKYQPEYENTSSLFTLFNELITNQ